MIEDVIKDYYEKDDAYQAHIDSAHSSKYVRSDCPDCLSLLSEVSFAGARLYRAQKAKSSPVDAGPERLFRIVGPCIYEGWTTENVCDLENFLQLLRFEIAMGRVTKVVIS